MNTIKLITKLYVMDDPDGLNKGMFYSRRSIPVGFLNVSSKEYLEVAKIF
jgi:hypothetical protein